MATAQAQLENSGNIQNVNFDNDDILINEYYDQQESEIKQNQSEQQFQDNQNNMQDQEVEINIETINDNNAKKFKRLKKKMNENEQNDEQNEYEPKISKEKKKKKKSRKNNLQKLLNQNISDDAGIEDNQQDPTYEPQEEEEEVPLKKSRKQNQKENILNELKEKRKSKQETNKQQPLGNIDYLEYLKNEGICNEEEPEGLDNIEQINQEPVELKKKKTIKEPNDKLKTRNKFFKTVDNNVAVNSLVGLEDYTTQNDDNAEFDNIDYIGDQKLEIHESEMKKPAPKKTFQQFFQKFDLFKEQRALTKQNSLQQSDVITNIVASQESSELPQIELNCQIELQNQKNDLQKHIFDEQNKLNGKLNLIQKDKINNFFKKSEKTNSSFDEMGYEQEKIEFEPSNTELQVSIPEIHGKSGKQQDARNTLNNTLFFNKLIRTKSIINSSNMQYQADINIMRSNSMQINNISQPKSHREQIQYQLLQKKSSYLNINEIKKNFMITDLDSLENQNIPLAFQKQQQIKKQEINLEINNEEKIQEAFSNEETSDEEFNLNKEQQEIKEAFNSSQSELDEENNSLDDLQSEEDELQMFKKQQLDQQVITNDEQNQEKQNYILIQDKIENTHLKEIQNTQNNEPIEIEIEKSQKKLTRLKKIADKTIKNLEKDIRRKEQLQIERKRYQNNPQIRKLIKNLIDDKAELGSDNEENDNIIKQPIDNSEIEDSDEDRFSALSQGEQEKLIKMIDDELKISEEDQNLLRNKLAIDEMERDKKDIMEIIHQKRQGNLRGQEMAKQLQLDYINNSDSMALIQKEKLEELEQEQDLEFYEDLIYEQKTDNNELFISDQPMFYKKLNQIKKSSTDDRIAINENKFIDKNIIQLIREQNLKQQPSKNMKFNQETNFFKNSILNIKKQQSNKQEEGKKAFSGLNNVHYNQIIRDEYGTTENNLNIINLEIVNEKEEKPKKNIAKGLGKQSKQAYSHSSYLNQILSPGKSGNKQLNKNSGKKMFMFKRKTEF